MKSFLNETAHIEENTTIGVIQREAREKFVVVLDREVPTANLALLLQLLGNVGRIVCVAHMERWTRGELCSKRAFKLVGNPVGRRFQLRLEPLVKQLMRGEFCTMLELVQCVPRTMALMGQCVVPMVQPFRESRGIRLRQLGIDTLLQVGQFGRNGIADVGEVPDVFGECL